VALAIALVVARQVRDEPSPAPPKPAASSLPAAAGVPGYFAAVLTAGSVVVGNARTGTLVTILSPPAGDTFVGVTAAADDRTFVLDTQDRQKAHAWYLLRVTPGTANPARLTRLPVGPLPSSVQIQGLALSPDAGTLAVLYQNLPKTISGSPGPYTLRAYSLVTGQALRTWTTPDTTKNWAITTPNPDNAADLTWLADGRTLAFRFPADTWPDDERTLSVTGKGTSLLAGSRPVLAVPGNDHGCTSVLLAANGQTTICGTAANSVRGCQQLEPEFDLYPVATGKLTSVLYRYRGTCQAANGILLWARSGSSAIAALEIIDETAAGEKGAAGPAATTVHFTVGLLTPGTFTPLHVVVPVRFGYLPGTIAF
jgi:hypothetical protein